MALRAGAQDPMRPWIQWRTIETSNYRFHFPFEFERWTVSAARRVESVDSAIASLVGSSTPKPVDVVVHDPFTSANGYALPLIDRPATVWWATPPSPRQDIGGFRSWGEMLSVHELTHLAHLTRPTRNPVQRLLWSTLPAQLGPLARRAPRWVVEGYATLLEGQITGSGRPHGVWRPALLRQWAIEGRLPSYAQMSVSDSYSGGDFAYLNGSAFFEWLERREGDSSLVHVWRRMSARTQRSFDQAFMGVFGEPPAILYGQHAAEVIADAMRARAALQGAGLHEGDLYQRLNWETGDPALSPDGARVALSLAERDKPRRLVVWRTAEDTMTAAARARLDTARARAARRDPQDVADRTFFPRPKVVVRSLQALNGISYQHPRWFADNRRLMVTRWTPRSDGTVAPDLYAWDVQTGGLRRLTRHASALQGDPSPDGREAVAMRCHVGHCDIVRVYLALGTVTSLLEGDPDRSYYRPRFSHDGRRFAASVSDSGRWRIIVADRDGKNARVVDPGDGANRYDAQWATGDTLIVVSERGGIPNLEYLSVVDSSVRAVTRVTGAALAPDVNRADGSTWFLTLHSRGLDIRRLAKNAPLADTAVTIDAGRFGFAGVQPRREGLELAERRPGPSDGYGFGVSHARWLPGVTGSPDGAGVILGLHRGDIVGRWNTTGLLAWGEPGAWQGGSLRTVWRYPRPAIELGAHWFRQHPSRGRDAVAGADSIDGEGYQGVVALSRNFGAESMRLAIRLGGAAGRLTPDSGPSYARTMGFADVDVQHRSVTGTAGGFQRLRFHYSDGVTRKRFQRVMATVQIGTLGRDAFPIQASGTMGMIVGSRHPFESFSLGGIEAAVVDSALFMQRIAMPALPTSAARGRKVIGWRLALPFRYTAYAEGVALTQNIDSLKWHRVVGVESRVSLPSIAVAFTPAVQARFGLGYSLDAPLNDRVRAYIAVRFEP